MTHRIRTALALAVTSLPLAAPAIASPSASAAGLALPWGDWLAGLLQPVTAALVPLAAAAVTAGIARVAPWAASVLTRDRIEAAIRAGAEFGQNAVAGAARGRTVSADLGAAVVAAGARHVLATAPRTSCGKRADPRAWPRGSSGRCRSTRRRAPPTSSRRRSRSCAGRTRARPEAGRRRSGGTEGP